MDADELQKRASDIAAELNNALAVILGNISLAKMHETSEEKDKSLTNAEKACLRAAGLVRKLFSLGDDDG